VCTGRPVEGCALRRLVFYGGADHWDLLPAQLPGGASEGDEYALLLKCRGRPAGRLATDLGIRLAARTLGLPATPAALTRHAATWRPWRAYATQYLWATGDHAINRLPPPSQAAMPGTSAGAG